MNTIGLGVSDFLSNRVSSREEYMRRALAGSISGVLSGATTLALADAGLAAVMGSGFAEGFASELITQKLLNENGEIDWAQCIRSGVFTAVMDGGLYSVTPRKEITIDNTKGSRPTWRQSELDAEADFPEYEVQKSFLNGQEVRYGTKGSVRPDFYKKGHSVDIKNYDVETAGGRGNLVRNIEKQYNQRLVNLPKGTKQIVMIDVRGQDISNAVLKSLRKEIRK